MYNVIGIAYTPLAAQVKSVYPVFRREPTVHIMLSCVQIMTITMSFFTSLIQLKLLSSMFNYIKV
jgi:hypothetical protein